MEGTSKSPTKEPGTKWTEKAQKVTLNYRFSSFKSYVVTLKLCSQRLRSKTSMYTYNTRKKEYPIISYFWEFLVVITWNCQGLGRKNTQQYLLEVLNKETPDILCLLETKQQNGNMHKILKSVNVHNYWLVPPRGQAGGMTMIWKHNLSVNIESSTYNQINAMDTEQCSNRLYMVSAFNDSPYPVDKQPS